MREHPRRLPNQRAAGHGAYELLARTRAACGVHVPPQPTISELFNRVLEQVDAPRISRDQRLDRLISAERIALMWIADDRIDVEYLATVLRATAEAYGLSDLEEIAEGISQTGRAA
jgi:hypothetical protein